MLSSILSMPYCSPPRHLFATVLLADSGRTGSLCSPWPHYMSPLIFCQGSLCGWYVLDRPTFPWEQVLPSSIDTVQLTLSYIKTTDLLSSSTTFHGTIMSLSAWAKKALVASGIFFSMYPKLTLPAKKDETYASKGMKHCQHLGVSYTKSCCNFMHCGVAGVLLSCNETRISSAGMLLRLEISRATTPVSEVLTITPLWPHWAAPEPYKTQAGRVKGCSYPLEEAPSLLSP